MYFSYIFLGFEKNKNAYIHTQESFLDPKFVELTRVVAEEPGQTAEGLMGHLQNHQQRIYSFPVLTPQFCRTLVEELVNYEESPLPKGRPNTMNSYGVGMFCPFS